MVMVAVVAFTMMAKVVEVAEAAVVESAKVAATLHNMLLMGY